MTRDSLIDKILLLCAKDSPLTYPAKEYQPPDEGIRSWAAQAPAGWFDCLLDVLAVPPDWDHIISEQRIWMVDEWQEWCLGELIAQGIRQDPDQRTPALLSLIEAGRSQLAIMSGFWNDNLYLRPLPMSILSPMVERASDMLPAEQTMLVQLIVPPYTEARRDLLLRARDIITEDNEDAHDNIHGYLADAMASLNKRGEQS